MNTYTPLASAQEVNDRIQELATILLKDYPDKSPLFVALLRGAAPFAMRLMQEITKQHTTYHPEIDYMMVSTYGDSQHAGTPQIVTEIAPTTDIEKRTVIILDDVLDKGITADFVKHHLLAKGVADVKLAVLCDKDVERSQPIKADYACFTFGNNWLVGMGMDDAQAANEGYRWLDEIWEIAK